MRNSFLEEERKNDVFIPLSKYYSINIRLDIIPSEEWTKDQLSVEIFEQYENTTKKSKLRSTQPLFIYQFEKQLYLFFKPFETPIEDEEESSIYEGYSYEGAVHRPERSYFFILSQAYNLFDQIKVKKVEIMQFDSQLQIFGYLSWKLFDNSSRGICKITKGKITQEEILVSLIEDIEKKIQDMGIEINKDYKKKVNGVIYKKQKNKIKTLCEFFDSRKIDDYCNFLFY